MRLIMQTQISINTGMMCLVGGIVLSLAEERSFPAG